MNNEAPELIRPLIFQVAERLSAERITLRDTVSGKFAEVAVLRMPSPFDGWCFSEGRFYVPLVFDKELNGILYHQAGFEDALLECKVFFARLVALSL